MGAVRALRPPMSPGGHSGRLSILQAAAIDDVRVGASALRMLVTLGTYADTETGWCRVKVRTIADRLGVSRQAASKALGQIAAYGYVEVQHEHDPRTGSQVASSYRLIMDFEVPDQYRRTPQPDIAGGVNLTLRTPTPDVAPPATSEVAPPVNPSLTAPATSEVAAIEERPSLTTQDERPSGEGVAADAAPALALETVKPSRSRKTADGPKEPKVATKAPASIELTDKHLKYAAEYGFTDPARVRAITDHFLGHHRFKGTKGLDWYAGWQGWIRKQRDIDDEKAAKRNGAHRPAPATSHHGATRLPARNVRTYEVGRKTNG